MRLPERDPYAPREWQPHEKPALLGSPSTPEHSTPKRIAYGVVGLLVCLTGALGNAVVTANLAEQSTPRCVVPPHRYWVPFHFWY